MFMFSFNKHILSKMAEARIGDSEAKPTLFLPLRIKSLPS